jgi:hypothetical protein
MSNKQMGTETRKAQAFTLRLPPDVHDQLRAYTFFTRRSANELVTDLLRDYLAGVGRAEQMTAMRQQGMATHREALDKLS